MEGDKLDLINHIMDIKISKHAYDTDNIALINIEFKLLVVENLNF